MVILIDNYDSFVYNLVQYLGELGAEPLVFRNDAVSVQEIAAHGPSHIVISPGPCTPLEAGVSNDVIRDLGARIPILGVCLGHQAIGHVYGGRVIRARRPMHGKTSVIHHDGAGLFAGLPTPLTGTRYHSLIVERETLPDCLQITAETEAGEIMGLRHRGEPVEGVQFHPEAVLTEHGHRMLANFLQRRR
ncbi:MAG: aminodeoxychorismate/anthranilate synthase component II [Armatimonadetes bacterium]|nr:aminodeoxychorismate/anthranilate synthase component II [Armatimonadota bacterium]